MAEHEEVQVRKKEQNYRGKSLEELKELDVRESAKFMPSRSRRSVLRNFDVIQKFVKRCEKKLERNKRIRTHLRDIIIVPKLVGMTIGIHNGKAFQEITTTVEMIGHRLGEFAMSRGKVNHGAAGLGATKSSRTQKK
ncbi:ribosomal protein S19 family protein [Candidatus Pacearchaeota archaeon]|nr:30S ribosomal protein S19 [uncultured archaeon]MBS3077478.1 ribosomal protein S19 family protein [Candidatus Pacearchaeota archaeon]